MKRAWLWFIRHTINPLMLRDALRPTSAHAIVRHVGRKSGIVRETPIIARPIPGGFMIELTYGPQVQWYRNVRAAGGFTLYFHGVEHRIVGFEEVDPEVGLAAFSGFERRVLRLLRRKDFIRLIDETPNGATP